QVILDEAVGLLDCGGDLRVAGRFRGDLEEERGVHVVGAATAPVLDSVQDALYEVFCGLDLLERAAPGFELALDDGLDDRLLAGEVPIDEPWAHPGFVRDVGNAPIGRASGRAGV